MTEGVVGMIGAGGIAHEHLPGWISLGHEVVVFSIDGNAPVLAERFGGRAVDTLDELLEAADIVDIVTPTDTHRELAERAAAAGCHVICEKPLGLTVEDAEAMVAACDAAGVRLFPAHVVRYFPAYAALKDAVESGRIGASAVQRFFRIGSAPKQGWFREPARSGGIALDQMIHDLDQARWIAGEAESVYATRVGRDEEGPTTVQAVMRHTSGAISQVHGVWGAPSLRFHTGYTAAGSDGFLEHDSLEHPVLSFDGIEVGASGYLPPVDPLASPYTAELADFARAIRDGDDARVTAADGVEAVRLGTAVNRSLAEGLPIPAAEPVEARLSSSKPLPTPEEPR